MTTTNKLCVMGAVLALAVNSPGAGEAAEPVREFLHGLRQRGYYDTAIDYLSQLESRETAPPDVRGTVKLEKAITLVAASDVERDQVRKQHQLDEAQRLLDEFIREQPERPQARTARVQLGNLAARRARVHAGAARRSNNPNQQSEARQLYRDARSIFEDHLDDLRKELAGIPKFLDRSDEQQAALADRRTQLRADYLQTSLLVTAMIEESADTFAVGSAERKGRLSDADKRYGEIHQRFRQYLGGLHAQLGRGRVHQKLGNCREALGHFVELLDQPESPEPFRILKTRTLRLAVDCWLDGSQKKYVEAINRCREWIATARPQDDQDADWRYLRLSLARAYMMQADETDPKNTRVVIASRNEAEKQAKILAAQPGAFQEEARRIVSQLTGRATVNRQKEVRNFAQASEFAQRQLDEVSAKRTALTDLESQLPAGAVPAGTDSARLATARRELQAAVGEAFSSFRLALRMADEETASDDLNRVRYSLAYLYYLRGDYYEGALMGDFVARHYPNTVSARRCAQLALACFKELYDDAPAGERHFESERVVATAEYILDRWPDQPEAEDAVGTLIPFLINAGELDKARDGLRRLPDGSPRKAAAAISTGLAVWREYLGHTRQASTGAQKDAASLSALKDAAHAMLTTGVDAFPTSATVTAEAATGALFLAQACLEKGESEQAVARLEDPRLGPLELIRRKHAAVEIPGYIEDAYKTAIRAHIAMVTQPNGGVAMQKIERLMQELAGLLKNGNEGQRRLVGVYVSIARELEQQLKVADPQAKELLSRSFETFLSKLSEGARDLSTLNWVAETLASLGAGFDNGDALNPIAARYYGQSASAFSNLLNRVDLEPALQTQIQVRLAQIRQHQHEYSAALDIYRSVLREKNTLVNVQVDAARALQQWASSAPPSDRESLFRRAMQGTSPDPQTQRNMIWGWGKIAKTTANRPQFSDTFHTARFNLATCRFKLAESKQGAERARLLELAERDITVTKRLYGLGGDRWSAQYAELLKQIQRSRGINPAGLQASRS